MFVVVSLFFIYVSFLCLLLCFGGLADSIYVDTYWLDHVVSKLYVNSCFFFFFLGYIEAVAVFLCLYRPMFEIKASFAWGE